MKKTWTAIMVFGLMGFFAQESQSMVFRNNWKACDVFLDEVSLSGSETGGAITYKKHIWLSSGRKNLCALAWKSTCDFYLCTTNRSLDAAGVNYMAGAN